MVKKRSGSLDSIKKELKRQDERADFLEEQLIRLKDQLVSKDVIPKEKKSNVTIKKGNTEVTLEGDPLLSLTKNKALLKTLVWISPFIVLFLILVYLIKYKIVSYTGDIRLTVTGIFVFSVLYVITMFTYLYLKYRLELKKK